MLSEQQFSASSKLQTSLNPLYVVECFRPFDRLRDLVYTLLFVTLYDDFPSLTAPQGERSDHARMGIAEP